MNQQNLFASTQIISFNPIIHETLDTRIQYFLYLKKLIHLVKLDRRVYSKAQTSFYQEMLCESKEITKTKTNASFDAKFSLLLPYDLTTILGFRSKDAQSEKINTIISKITSDFKLTDEYAAFLKCEFQAALGKLSAWDEVFSCKQAEQFIPYLKTVKRNIDFMRETPYKILITATMSAGKSTLINALVGKNISLVQNMACTSKIHTIVSKPFEDGVTSEYDYDLSINASQHDLLSDNNENKSNKITVSTYFNGDLAGKRLILLDSPGVNSSENAEHTEISQRVIKSKKYHLLLYVLNATQLGTNDDLCHLKDVHSQIGRTRIIFILNKVDQLISEDDDFTSVIEKQQKFLTSIGFKHPIICPVSSRAAYLAKKGQFDTLSRMEHREMINFMDKFELQSLSEYYENQLGCTHLHSSDEAQSLLINCGFTYLEQIIAQQIKEVK